MFVTPWRPAPDSVRFFQSPMTFPVLLGSLLLLPQHPLTQGAEKPNDSGCRRGTECMQTTAGVKNLQMGAKTTEK